jgi:beta-lactamase regulating signal transducer with metallopeptidase domain
MTEYMQLTSALLGESGAAAYLLDLAVKGTVILMLAGGLSLVMRRASASLRHLVWSVAIGAVLVLPVLTPLMPSWGVPGLPKIERSAAPTAESAPLIESAEPPAERILTPPSKDTGAEQASQEFRVARVGETPAVGSNAGSTDRLTGAGAGLAIAAGLIRTWQLARSAREVRSGNLARTVESLSDEMGLGRSVTLLRCSGPCMPMTWGVVQPRVLLPADAEEWPEARLRAVVLHELAHVKRWDYVTQLLARLTCGLYWFNPLVWLAAGRLRVERELACDDQVLRKGSRASEYAGHLLDMARSLKTSPLSGVTTVAMARPSQLSGRLLAVLDAGRARAGLSWPSVVSAWMGAAFVVMPIAGAGLGTEEKIIEASKADQPSMNVAVAIAVAGPAGAVLLQDCDWLGRSGGSSTSINSDDDRLRVKMERNRCELEIELDGVIEFTADETDIASLSRGGELDIEEKEGRDSRRLVVEENRGQLERRWYVDGDEREFDAEARAWLSDMILVMFRRVGYQATERAERILARDGVDGLLQEISVLASDWVAGRYYTILLSQADLDPASVRRVVQQAGETIDSDYQLAEMLIAVAENQPIDETVALAYVETAGSIDSDYEHRRVLSAILKRQGMSPELQQEILQSGIQISSDYELASLLIELIEARPLDDEMMHSFFAAVGTIDSDYEKRRVLNAAIERGSGSQEFLDMTLETAQDISSDYELGELLIEVAALYPVNEAVPNSYLAATRTIDSDYELGRVLKTLVERGNLSTSAQVSVLEACRMIDSDYEQSSLLESYVTVYGMSDATSTAFFGAVGGISSDYSMRSVLSTVVDKDPLTDATVEGVLEAALEISSDHEMGTLLRQVAGRRQIDDRLRPAFMRAADKIDSQYERGRVLDSAFPRGS